MILIKYLLAGLLILAVILAPDLLWAKAAFLYKEVNAIGGYSSRDTWTGKGPSLANSVGFEDYRKFSSEYGDYLTTDLQVRLSYDTNDSLRDGWGVEIHNAWLEYKLFQACKIKAGHFDPAFGLEPITDTHGTILQTLMPRSIGFKKDWGLAIKGSLSAIDYKAAFQLGSGMSIRHKDDSFLVTTRIGTPDIKDLQYGASFLIGNVLKSSGMRTFPRNHLLSSKTDTKIQGALDCQYNLNSFLVKGELSFGRDEDDNVLGYFGELSYTVPKYQNIVAKAQFQSWINDLGEGDSDDSTLGFSLSYKLNQKITLRTAYLYDLSLMGKKEDSRFLAQFYYYGL